MSADIILGRTGIILGAYADIKRYVLRHEFAHEQWSGYHSLKKMTDLEIFDFAVTNVGMNYNLLDILEPVELEFISTGKGRLNQ